MKRLLIIPAALLACSCSALPGSDRPDVMVNSGLGADSVEGTVLSVERRVPEGGTYVAGTGDQLDNDPYSKIQVEYQRKVTKPDEWITSTLSVVVYDPNFQGCEAGDHIVAKEKNDTVKCT